MPRQDYHLCSSSPFDFGGYCSSCHRRTNRTVAIDVSEYNVPLALAKLVAPPLELLRRKSVLVPYCRTCRGSLWTLRIASSVISIVFVCTLGYMVSGKNRKFWLSDAGMYLMFTCFFGLILIPFFYTGLKEYFLGVNVFFQDGTFYYKFRSPRVPQFLESQGLCKRAPDNDLVWIAVETE